MEDILTRQPHLVSGELTVENTTYCAARCGMCPREQYRFPWKHMDTAFFKEVVDQGVKLGMRSLDACGFGDPFMDPEYEQKLRYVRARYGSVKIYTSATAHMITQKRLGFVTDCIDTLKVSNYGFSSEVYRTIHRGVLNYENDMKNLQELMSIPKGRRPHVIMLFVVLPGNKHQVDDWKGYWEPKADEIMIWGPHNWAGQYSPYNTDDFGHSDEVARSCGRPLYGNLFVRVNGEVSMCCFDFNHSLIIGDLRRESLRDVLQSEPLQRIREVHRTGSFSRCNYLCKSCDQIYSRDDALIYSSNPKRRAGTLTSHPEEINDLLRRQMRNGKK